MTLNHPPLPAKMTAAERRGAAIVNAVLAANLDPGAETGGEGAAVAAEIAANLDHRTEGGEIVMIEAGAGVLGPDPGIETADGAAPGIVAIVLDLDLVTVTGVVGIEHHLAVLLDHVADQGLVAHIMLPHPPCWGP